MVTAHSGTFRIITSFCKFLHNREDLEIREISNCIFAQFCIIYSNIITHRNVYINLHATML